MEQDPSNPSPAEDSHTDPRADRLLKRVVLVVLLTVFVIFQFFVINLFRAGESINWKRELADIRQTYAEGQYREAARQLTEFGERWPGSRTTFNWNRQMGEYHAAAGDWETAARYYQQAVKIDDAMVAAGKQLSPTPAVRADAAEAHWKAGQQEAAIELAKQELTSVNRAVGDHDKANFYLGLVLKETNRPVEAFQHFQSIADREKWAKELDPIYQQIQTSLLEPAREKARSTALADIP